MPLLRFWLFLAPKLILSCSIAEIVDRGIPVNNDNSFWLNLGIVSVTDVGFISHVLCSGYIPMIPGITESILWVFAVIFTVIASRKPNLA